MVQKIPKPPGAQSDAELKQAQVAAGRLGDPTVPVSQKKAALAEIMAINQRQIDRVKALGIGGNQQETTNSTESDPFAGFTAEEKAEYIKEHGAR